VAERAAGQDASASGANGSPSTATETLSQFVARVLNQLSLSAWLPAAALVLLLAFVLQLGAVLDRRTPPRGPAEAIGDAFTEISRVSLGAALLLIAAVVVLTMVTQAFSFEAIQVLEGYWGPNRLVEWAAGHRCEHYRKVQERLKRRRRKLMERALTAAIAELNNMQQEQAKHGSVALTPNVISVVAARELGSRPVVQLNEEEKKVADSIKWEDHASPELLRRQANVERRLADFPHPERMQPTKLGNVLRRYEDNIDDKEVRTFIQRVFDQLPFSLAVEHDEQRNRLDLYCSMIFVITVVALVAVARFASQHLGYALGAIGIAAAGIFLMYRAAIATARAYGSILVLASKHIRSDQRDSGDAAGKRNR
jgi:hypothetical protein